MRIICLLLFQCIALLLCESRACSAQNELPRAFHPTVQVEKNTYCYAIDDTASLDLDLYMPAQVNRQLLPVVLFVHGGGFYTGSRNEASIEHFCDSLARAGFAVANISYRLTLEGDDLKFSCKQALAKKIAAIDAAATDLKRATAWLLAYADSLGLDSARFVASGSSAGAEAVLHAAYQQGQLNANFGIPKNFKYQAIMAFAGAVLDTTMLRERAVPTLLYHGTCDALVPYGTALHHYCDPSAPGAMRLHGSHTIFEVLRSANQTVRLVTRCRGQHGSAVQPFQNDINAVIDFLRRVNTGEQFVEHEIIETSGKPCAQSDWCYCKD
jgi:acetyl esterase/lipase